MTNIEETIMTESQSRLQSIADGTYTGLPTSAYDHLEDTFLEEWGSYKHTESLVEAILKAKGCTKQSKVKMRYNRMFAKSHGKLQYESRSVSKPVDLHTLTPEGNKLLGRVSLDRFVVRDGDRFWNRFHELQTSHWLGARLFTFNEDMTLNTKFFVSAVPLNDERVLTQIHRGLSPLADNYMAMTELAKSVEAIVENI